MRSVSPLIVTLETALMGMEEEEEILFHVCRP